MYDKPLPTYGDLLTRAEYMEQVECGGIIDYDGDGHPVAYVNFLHPLQAMPVKRMDASIRVRPSKRGDDLPHDATHVMWFNK